MELPITAFQSHELKLAFRGISRLKPHCPKRALPVTPHILRQIEGLLDFCNPAHTVFWSLFLLAFFTMSRKSNLVSTGKFDKNKQLCRQDVLLGSKGMLVRFKWSKTIQYGQRVLEIPLVAEAGNILCPVSAFKAMVQAVPAPKSGPAFVLPTNSGLQPVSYRVFQKFFRSCLVGVGLQADEFSSHSFRRGGASWAFRVQIPGELIKVQGDWASSAYLIYLDMSVDQRLQVAQRMLQCT